MKKIVSSDRRMATAMMPPRVLKMFNIWLASCGQVGRANKGSARRAPWPLRECAVRMHARRAPRRRTVGLTALIDNRPSVKVVKCVV